jgi:1-acyl-sn-glycerol-3-phosphate acyltransferase
MRFELDFPVIQNQYQTTPKDTGWFRKTFPSLCFYKKVLGVVQRAASLAKKGNYHDSDWCRSSYDTLKALESIGIHARVDNLQNLISLKEPCIVIGNHMSALETFLLPYLICPHKKLTFVIKEALISYPVFKHVMISRNPVVVGRSNPKQDFMTVLNEGVKRIEEGYTVVVFPQTTRMLEFDRSLFNSIGVKLARKAGVPVVPLALKTDCWGNGTLVKDLGRIDPNKNIHFEFGNPMSIEGNGKNQQETVIAHIENCLTRWNNNNKDQRTNRPFN